MRRPVSGASSDSDSSSGAATHAGSFEEFAGRVVRAQQRPHFRGDARAATAASRASSRSRPARVERQRFVEQRADAPQSCSRRRAHVVADSSSFASQARATRPVALHGGGRDAHRLGRLLDRQPAEEPQLDDARLARVELGQPGERGVERDHVDRALGRRRLQPLVERDARLAAAALQRVARARPLDQDLPHRVRGDGGEVGAVLPALGAVLEELEVRLVDERRRLQRLARALALQVVRREAPQLGVDQRHQRLERGLVAARRPIDEHVERIRARVRASSGTSVRS